MATWQLSIVGLEILELDEYNWPITRIMQAHLQIEENNISRLFSRSAQQRIKDRFPQCCDLIVTELERIDRQTGKDYGSFGDRRRPSDLVYTPSSEQQQFIKQAQADILAQVIGDDEIKELFALLLIDTFLRFITDDKAFLQDNRGKISTHKQAKFTITALENFYTQITPGELAFLRIDKGALHPEDLELLRLYNTKNLDQYRSSNLFAVEDEPIPVYSTEEHEERLHAFLNLRQNVSIEIFSKLLDWMVQNEQSEQILEKLEHLNIDDLQKINILSGVSNLKNILAIWQHHQENHNEEFWQKILSQNSFVLSQIFSYPVILLHDKAYVGGKSIDNQGGNLLDFLYANDLTRNAALIEIKTPKTRILGPSYRGDIYNISSEISGAMMQISNYKDTLTKEYANLSRQGTEQYFEAFNPPCIVIAGNSEKELTDHKKRKSFELFRTGLSDVQIITYDELFKKIEILLDLLEGKA